MATLGEHELKALDNLFSSKNPVGSGKAWIWIDMGTNLGRTPGNSIRKNNIIGSLNYFVYHDLLAWKDVLGKGSRNRFKKVPGRQESVKVVVEEFAKKIQKPMEPEGVEFVGET